MAAIPGSLYPGQIDNSDLANYPQGKAQNITVPSDGTGTPLEKQWLNDLFGFEQSLLDAGGVVPNGAPDSLGNPQYVEAIRNLISGNEGGTRYNIADEPGAAPVYDSTSHMFYRTLTNVGAITAQFNAASGAFGDSVVLEKGAGSGAVTLQGDVGITIELKVGDTLTIDTDGEAVSCISKNATTWKLIK